MIAANDYTRAVGAAAVLAVMAWALPVQINRAEVGAADPDCLALADHPPPPDAVARIPELERCRLVAAHDPDLAADLAAAYAAAGRDSDAERAYRDAIALDPDFGDAFVKLAELLLKRGAVEEARVYAEAARQLQPNSAAVGQLLARLDRTAGAGTP